MGSIDVSIFREDFIRSLMLYSRVFSKILDKKLILGIKELKSSGKNIFEIKFRDENKILFFSFIYYKEVDENNLTSNPYKIFNNCISKIRIYDGNLKFYNSILDFFIENNLKYSQMQISKFSLRN